MPNTPVTEALCKARVESLHNMMAGSFGTVNTTLISIQQGMDSQAQSIDHLSTKVDDIHDRLTVDNGRPSHQTLLDRHETELGGWRKVKWLVLVSLVTMIASALKSFFGMKGG